MLQEAKQEHSENDRDCAPSGRASLPAWTDRWVAWSMGHWSFCSAMQTIRYLWRRSPATAAGLIPSIGYFKHSSLAMQKYLWHPVTSCDFGQPFWHLYSSRQRPRLHGGRAPGYSKARGNGLANRSGPSLGDGLQTWWKLWTFVSTFVMFLYVSICFCSNMWEPKWTKWNRGTSVQSIDRLLSKGRA